MPKLTLTDGQTVLVDKEDLKRCQEFEWAVRRGTVSTTVRDGEYARWRILSLARFIMGFTPDYPFIFLNGDKMDFRKHNLKKHEPTRLKKIVGMDSKWSAFKEKLLCKSSSVATS